MTTPTTPVAAGSLDDRQAISDAVTRLLSAVDRRDWISVAETLAAHIDVDYTSLFGGTSMSQPATELVNGWRALLPGFDGTQHLTGAVLASVDGDRTRATCAVTAVHRLGADHWTVNGHYDLELRREASGWKITSFTYRHLLTSGDPSLPGKAHARVAAAAT